MPIVFFCQSCGSRFEVADGMAGKKGHCRTCDQRMVIPLASEIASMAAVPAVAASGSAGGPSWIDRSHGSIGLAPLTAVGMGKVYVPKPSPLDDASNSALYSLADGDDRVDAKRTNPVGTRLADRRRRLGAIQKVARWINQSAYLLSVPFIMMILAGIALKNRPLALFGATVVVLLNLSRIVSGVFNVLIIPFRESPVQGVLSLFPPYTVYYVSKNWKKMKKPVQRVAMPILTIGLVFVSFTFIPWLTRDGKAPTGVTGDKLLSGFTTLRDDISTQLGQVRNLDLSQIEAKGGLELSSLKARLTDTISSARSAQGQPKYVPKSSGSSPGGSLSELVNELQRLQAEINGLNP